MMSRSNAQRFDEAVSNYQSSNYSQALCGVEALTLEVLDPWNKAEVLYHEIITLVVLHKTFEARQRVNALNRMVESLVQPSSDGCEYNFQTSLPVMACHAEIRVMVEEGNSAGALALLDDLIARYPKQLSIPEFRTVCTEPMTLRGMLLGDMGQWVEAKPLLESTAPPQSWKGVHTYYLGHCYYESGLNDTAKAKLSDALKFELPKALQIQAHYLLGLIEYHFSNMEAAKSHFEICAENAKKYVDVPKLWAWLEATSKALGQSEEAEKYHDLLINESKLNSWQRNRIVAHSRGSRSEAGVTSQSTSQMAQIE